ncbi:MAG: type II toxin-antitoxin system RatA family toxin [Pseudomonadota bacterium]
MMHRKTEIAVPYTARQMFDLVSDVERYPAFLPWCSALRIVKRTGDEDHGEIIADMVVAYKVFREKFRSRVILDRAAGTVCVDRMDGPFRTLRTDWRFADSTGVDTNADSGSVVYFEITFELKNLLFQRAAQLFFERKFLQMSEAFIDRAHDVYGAVRA